MSITGSIPKATLTVIDLATEQVAWEAKMSGGVRPMAIEANPDGSTKRIFAQLSDLNGFAVVDFAARKEIARIELPKPGRDFETDAGRAIRRRRTASASRRTTRRSGSPASPTTPCRSIRSDDLKMIGQVALPALKLPGHDAISAVANWVTFTPDGKTIYISNAASGR